ncbi:MAG: hypothetical protein U5L45_07560 [Saprospiraceae bacterium]|nr:hypothetical protein [Saprospiraceae bacterium]
MVRFSGFARKTNHIPFLASEASVQKKIPHAKVQWDFFYSKVIT